MRNFRERGKVVLIGLLVLLLIVPLLGLIGAGSPQPAPAPRPAPQVVVPTFTPTSAPSTPAAP